MPYDPRKDDPSQWGYREEAEPGYWDFPGFDPSDTYPYGTEYNWPDLSNPPVFQPWENPYADELEGLLGGPPGMDWLEIARNMEPGAFLDMLPYGEGQIWDYITKKLTGAGAGERAGEYRELGLGQVNRAFTDIYDEERQRVAGTGGRGSSFQAARESEGRAALGGARADVEAGALEYEDALRREMFGQGMGALGAYEGAFRGDEQAQANYQQFLAQSLYPELQALGIDVSILQGLSMQEMQAWMDENGFNIDIYSIVGGQPPSPSLFEQIAQFIPGLG